MAKKSKAEQSRIAKRAARVRAQNKDKEMKKRRAALATKNRREKTGGHSPKRQELKKKVMLAYSKKYLKKNGLYCFCCRKRLHLDFLTMDHVKGRKQMEKDKQLRKIGYMASREGPSLNNWLMKNKLPKGFQVLCWNCNTTKELYGLCPHKRK